jgi:hypothetical protein
MTLSEAIRLGSMVGAQAFGRLWGRDGSSCALGAALRAVGATTVDSGGNITTDLRKSWPWVLNSSRPLTCPCPACPMEATCIAGVIVHLNDSHHWTRRAIADFVERFEPAPTEDAVDPVGEPVTADVGAPTSSVPTS